MDPLNPDKHDLLPVSSTANFARYVGVSVGPEIVRTTTGSGSSPNNVNMVPIGSPLTLTAQIPTPGSTLPALDALPVSTVPASAIPKIRWVVSVQSKDGGYVEVRPGTALEDTGAAYHVADGGLNSTLYKIVPWPSDEIPSANRGFRVQLEVDLWWPGRPVSGSPTLVPVTTFQVCPYTSLFVKDQHGDLSFDPSLGTDPMKADPVTRSSPLVYIQNLFKVSVDTLAPAAGQPINFLVQENKENGASAMPGVVQSIMEQTPNFQIQAGLDLGGYVNSLLQAAKTVLPDDDTVQLAQDSTANVRKILSGLLSIPIAVAVNGSNTTKTILPTAGSAVSSLKTLGDSNIVGDIPIGSLMAKITMDAQNLAFDAIGKSNSQSLKSSFVQVSKGLDTALSLVPLPKIIDFGGSLDNPPATVTIKLPVSIRFPGTKAPISFNLPVSSFEIAMPVLQIPQIFMGFKDANYGGSGMYWSLDPTSNGTFHSASDILQFLQGLLVSVKKLVDLLPRDVMSSLGLGDMLDTWLDIINAANFMSTKLQGSNTKSTYTRKLEGLGWPGCYDCILEGDSWWKGGQGADHSGNISSFVWLGAPFSNIAWRLLLGYDDYVLPKGVLAMPFLAQPPPDSWTPRPRLGVCAITAANSASGLSVQDAIVFNSFHNGPTLGKLVGNGTTLGYDNEYQWDEKIRYLVWTQDRSSGWRLNTNPDEKWK